MADGLPQAIYSKFLHVWKFSHHDDEFFWVEIMDMCMDQWAYYNNVVSGPKGRENRQVN